MRARVVKNKVAAPFRVAEFDIMFNQGISKMGDILEIGVDQGVVKKSGAFYSYGETKLGQGRENSKDFLIQHPEIAESIEGRLRSPVDEHVAQEPESPEFSSSSGLNSVADFLANNGLEQDDKD